jgi:hypothetical protein
LTSALTNQGPYEFAGNGAWDDYIDLANTYLFVEAQIVDDDDAAFAFLSENVIRCVSLLGLPKSGLFPLGRFFYSSLSWGSYRVHSFLE